MVTILGTSLVSCLAILGLGIHLWWMHWNSLLQRQLKLDRCVGQVVKTAFKFHKEIVFHNRAIIGGRLIAAATQTAPPVAAAAKAALEVSKARQKMLLLQWKGLPITFGLKNCPPEVLVQFPPVPWDDSQPRDPIGPRPATWTPEPGKKPFYFRFQSFLPTQAVSAAAGFSPKKNWPCQLRTGADCSWNLHWGPSRLQAQGVTDNEFFRSIQSATGVLGVGASALERDLEPDFQRSD